MPNCASEDPQDNINMFLDGRIFFGVADHSLIIAGVLWGGLSSRTSVRR